MTLGPALIFLGSVEGRTLPLRRPVLTFGQVPLFYFLLHLPLIHLVAVAVCYARYGVVHWMFESPSIARFPVTFPPDWGLSLPVVYFVWASVVCALYPLCAGFVAVKQKRRAPWLRYV